MDLDAILWQIRPTPQKREQTHKLRLDFMGKRSFMMGQGKPHKWILRFAEDEEMIRQPRY